MSSQKTEREIKMLKFIQENEPCEFGDIKQYLIDKDLYFKVAKNNNTPLARKLKELETNEKIKINKDAKPYPTYSTIQDYAVDTAIMGDLFKMNFTKTFFTPVVEINGDYIKNDIPLESWDDKNVKFIKSMVTRYGFYMFSVLVKSYEQSIKLKNFDRKIWIKNAMNLMENEEEISNDFLNLLDIPFEYPKPKIPHWKEEDSDEKILDIEEHPELDKIEDETENYEIEDDPPLDLSKRKNKKLLKEKLEKIRKSMKKTYPKMSESIHHYDFYFESNPEKIREKDFIKINRKNW